MSSVGSEPRPVSRAAPPPFALYVEGPRDRDILQAWARRAAPHLARELARAAIILGGCRPARAIEHFRAARLREPAMRGLCVLDRDGRVAAPPGTRAEPGLEFFVWRRRHIESYLLVPQAIRRSAGLRPQDPRVERFFRTELPDAADETGLGEVDAKRLFAAHGALARAVGRPVLPGRVARAMRPGELHADVIGLLARLERGLGFRQIETAVRGG